MDYYPDIPDPKKETNDLMQEVKKRGFNVYSMIDRFKKVSKLSDPLPDEVIQAVCYEYLLKERNPRQDFPYFLTVLRMKSADYFARQNIKQHDKVRNAPTALRDILRKIAA